MDEIFLPRSKRWIYPPYAFPSEEQARNNVELTEVTPEIPLNCDISNSVDVTVAGGVQTDLLKSVECGVDNESGALRDGIGLHQQILKCEDGGFEFEEVEPLAQRACPFGTEGAGSSIQLGCHEDSSGNLRSNDEISRVGEGGEQVAATNPAVVRVEGDICPPKKRTRKRRKVEIEEPVEQEQETISEVNWEEGLRQNLAMTDEEFKEFKKSQCFDHQSSKLPSLFDFGVPDPKGMPQFATKIPESYFEHSNALRVYQNILKPSYTSGTLIFNAADRAFYKPDADKHMPISAKDKVDPGDMIVTVECYHPSPSISHDFSLDLKNTRLPGVSVRVEILASQTLADLQSRLHCENDFIYVKEIYHPDDAKRLNFKNCACLHDEATFQTSAICINETIYTSDVKYNYGDIISNWKGQTFLGNSVQFKTGSLSTKLCETSFKPGYPYLYRHGGCEHLLMFTNLRTLHPNDPRSLKCYPRVIFIHHLPPIRCRVNSQHMAKFVVKDNPRLPEPVVPLCKECCVKFCYSPDRQRHRKREVKVGSFKLYPLIQKYFLPISDITL